MQEITFLVQEAEEGGYTARALGKSIFTEGETLDELRGNIREAVQCYFGEEGPRLAHLHVVNDEILSLT